MASHFNHLSFFLLLLVLSSAQIDARVNKFFSKFIHTDNTVPEPALPLPEVPSSAPVSSPPELAPTLVPTPAPAPFFDESQNAYGLYGDSDDQFSSTSTENNPTITDVEEQILAEDTGEESYKSGYPKTNTRGNNYDRPSRYNQYENNHENNYKNNYENNYESNEYRRNEYEATERQGMSDTRFMEKGKYENNHENNYENNYESNEYRRNEYEATERQGMSDTRFMEKGKYYYDVHPGNGGNHVGGNSEREGSYRKYPNEFDSTEEFDNEDYGKNEEFLP